MAHVNQDYSSNVLRDDWFTIVDGSTAASSLAPYGLVAASTIDTEIASGTTLALDAADALEFMVAGTGADNSAAVFSASRMTKVPNEDFYMMEPGIFFLGLLCAVTVGQNLLGLASTDRWVDGGSVSAGFPLAGESNGIILETNSSDIPARFVLHGMGATHVRVQTQILSTTNVSVIGRRFAGMSQRI